MKKFSVFILALLILSITSVYSQQTDKLEGVWKLIYQKQVTPETSIEHSQFVNSVFKIFTEKHFSLSRLDEDNQFGGHFGKYSYDSETYTEHIKYSSFVLLMGQSVKFKSKISGDKWTIEGVIEIEGEELKLKETWQRVE
ncbi:MAG: DUF4488 domain-containing protein [Candidatus Kariarchaeaceae archaeon]|jgi:hypothetical protein